LKTAPTSHTELSLWNYDGSSTNQAVTEKSEVELRPVKMIKDPFRNTDTSFLVLCETYNIDGTPHRDNTRSHAVTIFNMETTHLNPLFGLEQELFISRQTAGGLVPVAFPDNQNYPRPQGDYYCGVGGANILGRKYVEEILKKLVYCELPITGMNAEVAPGQWEFQVCSTGIDAADSLILVRYIINRVLERDFLQMDISAKPVKGDWNGSGCHINYSTSLMRVEAGFKHIESAIKNLEEAHALHIRHYGSDNSDRLTGHHETSSMDSFSYSVGGRNTSIRIPYSTKEAKRGYFEDRRPSSSLDPYKSTALLHATSVGLNQEFWN
jgi:glutamine synthetase